MLQNAGWAAYRCYNMSAGGWEEECHRAEVNAQVSAAARCKHGWAGAAACATDYKIPGISYIIVELSERKGNERGEQLVTFPTSFSVDFAYNCGTLQPLEGQTDCQAPKSQSHDHRATETSLNFSGLIISTICSAPSSTSNHCAKWSLTRTVGIM